jgi:hypothetical protein
MSAPSGKRYRPAGTGAGAGAGASINDNNDENNGTAPPPIEKRAAASVDYTQLISAIQISSTVNIGVDTFFILNAKDRALLEEKMRALHFTDDEIGEVNEAITKALTSIIDTATQLILSSVGDPTNRSTKILIRMFVHQVVWYNKLLYVPTQQGTTCVSDFLLSTLFRADYIRNLFYSLVTPSGGNIIDISDGSTISIFFREGIKKFKNIVRIETEHVERFLKYLATIYDRGLAKIGPTNKARSAFTGAMVRRQSSMDTTKMGEFLRYLVNDMELLTVGVCFTNLSTFLDNMFVKFAGPALKGKVSFRILKSDYSNDNPAERSIIVKDQPFSSPAERTFRNLFAIMLQVNQYSTTDPDIPASSMHHATGFVLHNGVWFFVDNENKGIAIPVSENIVEKLFNILSSGELFEKEIKFNLKMLYDVLGTHIPSLPLDKMYIRIAILFHASADLIATWETTGRAEAMHAEASLHRGAIAELASKTFPETAAASAVVTNALADLGTTAAPVAPRTIPATLEGENESYNADETDIPVAVAPPVAPRAIPDTLEGENESYNADETDIPDILTFGDSTTGAGAGAGAGAEANAEPVFGTSAGAGAGAVFGTGAGAWSAAAPSLQRSLTSVLAPVPSNEIGNIERAKAIRSAAIDGLAALREALGDEEVDFNEFADETRVALKTARPDLSALIDMVFDLNIEATHREEEILARSNGRKVGSMVNVNTGGGRRRRKHRTYRKRKHAPKTRSKTKSKRKQTRHRRKN